MIRQFIALFYPDICAACENHLASREEIICSSCRYNLPYTDFHQHSGNQLVKHFWGKVKIEAAAAFLYFNKGEKVQRLIHNLKYRKQKNVGVMIGKMYGLKLLETSPYNSIDYVIPVPLHPSKLNKRGFNQSEMFAMGLSEGMNRKCLNDLLIRSVFSETQTKKNRFQRWNNVKDIFCISPDCEIGNYTGAHFLLVDDVVTTGSTLEASAQALLGIPHAKVSIATMAYSNT